MRARCPSASPIAIGFVSQRRLVFHKRSIDGSAKADAVLTSLEEDRVWGVVYRINAMEKLILDEYESLGIGYDLESVLVASDDERKLGALMYVARGEMIDSSLQPYSWYVDFVVSGARQHRLPWCYINVQLKVATIADPDMDRENRNRQILASQSRSVVLYPKG